MPPDRTSGNSILIVHADRKTQRTIQRILGVTGYRIDIVEDVEQALRLLQHAQPVLIVIDAAAALGPQAAPLFSAAEACLTLVSGPLIASVPKLLGLGAVTNLLVHPMPVLAEELTITAHKLIKRDLFGAEKYLLWGTELHAMTMQRASQRGDQVHRVGEHVRSLGQSARVASMAMLVTDELLSNAVHNAPVDGSGVHYLRDVARDVERELDAKHEVRMRWGCDARYLTVEVTDNWGTLQRDQILDALAATDVRESGGGAGMGVALAYRSCDHLVFNLAPGRRTQVIAMIDVRYPPAERVPASSYNIFVERSMEPHSHSGALRAPPTERSS